MNSEDYQFLNNLENIHTLPRENIQQIITIYDNQIGTRSRPQIQTSIRDRVLPLIMRIHQQQQLQLQQQLQQQQQQADLEQLKDKRNRHSEDEPPPKRGKHNPLQPELSRVLGGKRSSNRNRRTKKMQRQNAKAKTKRQRKEQRQMRR